MTALKKFIDKVGVLDYSNNRDFVMSSREAKQLRDEIIKLLVEKVEVLSNKENKLEVEMNGGRW